MYRKLLVLVLLGFGVVSVDASQDQRVLSVRFDLNPHETRFFDEQIRKLQQLRLPFQQEDGLYLKFEKKMNDDEVELTALVGVSDRQEGRVYPSRNYHNNDEAHKILYDVHKYLADQSDQRILLVMISDLQIGQSRLYHMPFERE